MEMTSNLHAPAALPQQIKAATHSLGHCVDSYSGLVFWGRIKFFACSRNWTPDGPASFPDSVCEISLFLLRISLLWGMNLGHCVMGSCLSVVWQKKGSVRYAICGKPKISAFLAKKVFGSLYLQFLLPVVLFTHKVYESACWLLAVPNNEVFNWWLITWAAEILCPVSSGLARPSFMYYSVLWSIIQGRWNRRCSLQYTWIITEI